VNVVVRDGETIQSVLDRQRKASYGFYAGVALPASIPKPRAMLPPRRSVIVAE
jgi:hypothetical protein